MYTRNIIMDINNMIDNEINKILDKKNNKDIDTLILSGGSIKGIAQLGALHCLLEHKIIEMDKIKNIAGTSAGTMVGLLLCIGYKPIEVFRFMKLVNLEKTRKIDMSNLITKFGLDNGKRIMLVLTKLLKSCNYSEDITFKELYNTTFINFIVTGSCINDKKVYYFSHTDYPDMKVLKAIRISMAIPIFFTPVKYENKIFIDGCCLDNYPIHLFNNRLDNVLGLYVLDNREYVSNIKCIEDYLSNTMNCLLDGMVQKIDGIYKNHTITITCNNFGDTISDVISLFDTGYNSIMAKIDSNFFTHLNISI